MLSVLSLMVIFATLMKSFLFSVRAFQNVTFFLHWNVTFPCSNVIFKSLVLQFVHHISLGRPIKSNKTCHEAVHCYAAFDFFIDILDEKSVQWKKSYAIYLMYSITQNVSFCSLSYANVIFNTGLSDSFHASDCSWLIYLVIKSLSTFRTSLPVS